MPACGPHLHVRVEAVLPPFLPVTLGVEGQLVGARLHLAWQQEPRAASIGVGVAGGRGDEVHPCLAVWISTPRILRCPCSLTWERLWCPGFRNSYCIAQKSRKGENLPQSTPGAIVTSFDLYFSRYSLFLSMLIYKRKKNVRWVILFLLFYNLDESCCLCVWLSGSVPVPVSMSPAVQAGERALWPQRASLTSTCGCWEWVL